MQVASSTCSGIVSDGCTNHICCAKQYKQQLPSTSSKSKMYPSTSIVIQHDEETQQNAPRLQSLISTTAAAMTCQPLQVAASLATIAGHKSVCQVTLVPQPQTNLSARSRWPLSLEQICLPGHAGPSASNKSVCQVMLVPQPQTNLFARSCWPLSLKQICLPGYAGPSASNKSVCQVTLVPQPQTYYRL
jgi:hypothetical protein